MNISIHFGRRFELKLYSSNAAGAALFLESSRDKNSNFYLLRSMPRNVYRRYGHLVQRGWTSFQNKYIWRVINRLEFPQSVLG